MAIDHTDRFLKALSSLTDVSFDKLKKYATQNNPLNLIHHPHNNVTGSKAVEKIYCLRELMASYQVLVTLENYSSKNFCRSELAREYFLGMLSGIKDKEVVVIAFLDNSHNLIETAVVGEGTINQAILHVREVVKQALACDCVSIIMAHNHPSGNTQFSEDDKKLTNKLYNALAQVDISMLDHILIAGTRAVSMAEYGLMPTRATLNAGRER